jgi:hypothetical protein
VLTVEVVQLLHSQGVAVSEAIDNVHQAVEASAELLRAIGIIPDKRALARPSDHTSELIAAAVLMRAAGIEPSMVKIWPRRTA